MMRRFAFRTQTVTATTVLPHPLHAAVAASTATTTASLRQRHYYGTKTASGSAATAKRPPPQKANFDDKSIVFRHKSLFELLHAACVFQTCQFRALSDNPLATIGVLNKIFGKQLVERVLLRHSVFRHFCAGEDSEEIKPTLKRLADQGIGSILDYAAEAQVPEMGMSVEAPDVSITTLVSRRDVRYALPETMFDENAALFLQCVQHAAENMPPSGLAYAAVKFTAMGSPQLLARGSAVLLDLRRSWISFFTADVPPKLQECRCYFPLEQGRFVSHEAFAAGIAKLTQGGVSQGEIDGMIRALDPADANRIDKLVFRRLLGPAITTLQFPKGLEPLAPFLPSLTPDEAAAFVRMIQRCESATQLARTLGVRVTVDAEQTFYQMAIDHLVRRLQREYNTAAPVVYNTYQCYLTMQTRRLENDFMRAETEGWMFGGKIVRGAYMREERETAGKFGFADPIHRDQRATDACFDDVSLRILKEMERCPDKKYGVLYGTHNQASTELLSEYTRKMAPNKSEVAFAQLYGMSDCLTVPLAQAGFNAYKYVPYGPVGECVQYLSRRAQENSMVVSGSAGELAEIKGEIKRRMFGGKPHAKKQEPSDQADVENEASCEDEKRAA